MQIQSRIVGTTQWQEVASGIDPTLGEVSFQSNSPGAELEVQGRFRMVNGVFSPWVGLNIISGGVKVDYSTGLKNQPTKLADVNPTEGNKLGGIAPGADVTANNTARDTAAVGGVASGTITDAIKDAGGNILRVRDIQASIDPKIKAATDAQQLLIDAAKKAGDDANLKIDSADSTLNKAILAAKKAGDDANADLVTVKRRTSDLETSIDSPTNGLKARVSTIETSLTNGDSNQALTQRTSVLEAAVRTDKPSRSGEFDTTTDFQTYWSTSLTDPNQPSAAQVVNAWEGTNCVVSPGYLQVFSTIPIPVNTSRHYTITARVGAYLANPTGPTPLTYVGVACLDADGKYISHGDLGSYRYSLLVSARLPSNEIREYSATMSGESNTGTWQQFAPGTKFVKLMFIFNEQRDSAYQSYIDYIRFYDAEAETQISASNARISTVETAYSDPTTGLARRATDLETSLNTPTTGVKARLSTAENVLSNPTTGLVKRTDDLTVNYKPIGNIVSDSAILTLDGWQFNDVAGGGSMTRNRAGTTWMLGGVENNLTLHNPNDKGDGLYSEAYSPPFAVTPGSTVQFYAYAMSHRALHWVSLMWLKSDGTTTAEYYAGEYMGVRHDEGGQNPNFWEITGSKGVVVPPTAVAARMMLRQYGNTRATDRYSWFSRLFVSEVAPGCSVWMTYAPGDNRSMLTQSNARLSTAISVLGDASGGIVKRTSDLEATYNAPGTGVNARLSTTENVVSNPTTGLVQRTGALETTINTPGSGALARIGSLENVTTNGTFSAASRTSSLEAQMGKTSPSGLGSAIDGVYGQVNNPGGALARITSLETVTTNGTFATAVRASNLEAQMNRTTPSVLGNDINYLSGQINNPGGALARISNVETVTTNGTFAAASTVSTLRSEYDQTAATVTQQAGTISALGTKTAAYWQVTTDAGLGRAQLAVRADAYGNAGVDIVGDVQIKGQAGSGRSVITGSGMTVYDSNNVMRVRLGLW
jgi:hypothetical protein